MAYADTQTHLNGLGISAAIAINGLLVAGIILSVPHVLPKKFRDTGLIRIAIPIIQDLAPIRKPQAHKPADNIAKPAQPLDFVPESSAQSQALAGDISLYPGDTGDIGSVAPIEPLPPGPPIFKTAQIDPRYIKALQPTYPPGMVRAEMEGVVTIRVLIGTDGRVRDVETVSASEPAFLESTRKQAFAKWRFLPAMRDGAPVESWREMTVRFQLPD